MKVAELLSLKVYEFTMLLLLCSHSHNHVPIEPQRNESMATVVPCVRPCINYEKCQKIFISL